MKKYILIIIYLYIYSSIISQNYKNSFYQKTKIDNIDTNSLHFSVENSNFFKNNEYFNKIIEGYTLIGYFIHPKIVYYPSNKIKIETGVYMLKYSGIDDFTQTLPTLRFHIKTTKSLDIVIGNLYGSINHDIVEPIFEFERYFTNNIENGLQFLINKPRVKSDIWINWENFIFKGEDKQEEFTLGISNTLNLLPKISKHKLTLPIKILTVHRGGQINETDKNLVTYNNISTGIRYDLKLNSKRFKSIGFYQYFLTFNDLSPTKTLPYIQGYAWFSKYYLRTKYLHIEGGYWFGDYFFSERGSPIFRTVSTFEKDYSEDQRSIITGKILFEKKFLKGIYIGSRFEVYYDLYNYILDYSYSFYINFRTELLLKKLK